MTLFSTAYAAVAASDTTTITNAVMRQGSPWNTVVMLLVFFGIFYFLLIRPQQKRAKQHRLMVTALTHHDEVVTTGGIMGKITELENNIVTLEIAPDINIKIQKTAIGAMLPKGSLKF